MDLNRTSGGTTHDRTSLTEGKALLNLLQSRHGVLLEIRDFTARQQGLIAAKRITALLELLSEKQHSVQRLSELESQLVPHRKIEPADRRWESEQQHECCRAVRDQSDALLAEILQLEADCERQLESEREAISQQLSSTHSAAEACRAYQQHS